MRSRIAPAGRHFFLAAAGLSVAAFLLPAPSLAAAPESSRPGPSAPPTREAADDTYYAGYWSMLGPYGVLGGMDASANAMVTWQGGLYAAGTIGSYSGSPNSCFGANQYSYPPCIAEWSGGAWTSPGGGLNNNVNALAASDDTLYAGGIFDGTGSQGMFGCSQAASWGRFLACIGAWNGSTWSPLGEGLNNTVNALTISGDAVVAGGQFSGSGSGTGLNYVAAFADDTWSPLGTGTNNAVYALATGTNGTLYAGGTFTNAGGGADDSYIAAWNGTVWSPLGAGMNGTVNALVTGTNGTLYAGGAFTTPGNHIATWNGTAWSALGGGKAAAVNAIALDSARGLVYAGGGAPNNPLDLSVWDSAISTWIPFGQPPYYYPCFPGGGGASGQIDSIVADDSTVYIGGDIGAWTCIDGNGQIEATTVAAWSWLPPTGANSLSARVDDTVVVTGSGFIGIPLTGGVKVGSTVVPYVRDDSSTITVTLPDTLPLGSQPITVNAVGGWANVGTVSVTASPPSAPTSVSGKAASASVAVSWKAPAKTGGSPITKYTVAAKPGGKTCTTTGALTCTVTGLTNGTAYTFTVTATNAAGTGPVSTASAAVTPTGAPGSPTAVAASPGNGQVTVSWKAPSSNGGSPITKYTVTAKPGGKTCTTTGALTCTVTGLTNGTAYTFTVTAASKLGTSVPSSAASATPRTVPGAPTNVQGQALTGGAMIVWKAPASTGGSPITKYKVTSSPGGKTCVATSPFSSLLSCRVWGLTKGKEYTFTVTSTNAAGSGPASRWYGPPVTPL